MSSHSYRSSQDEWTYRKNGGRKRWLNLRRSLILLGFCLVGGVFASLWVGSALIASANRDIGPPPTKIPYDTFSIASESGSELAAWYARAENSKATIILLHPLRGSRTSMLSRAKFLFDAGYSVLLVDFQAHGESLGKNITMGYLEKYDAEAAVANVKRRFPDDQIIIIGNSLGGAAALLASPMDVDGMVLEAVYPRIEKAIQNRVNMRLGPLIGPVVSPLLTVQIEPRLGIALNELQPIEKIHEVGCPLLLLAGQNDAHTTIEESQEMFDVAKEPKKLEVVPRAEHVDLHRFDSKFYEEKVLNFVNKIVSSDPVSQAAVSPSQ